MQYKIYGGQLTEFSFTSQEPDEGLLQLTILFSVVSPPEDPNSVIFGRKLTVDGWNQEKIWCSPLKDVLDNNAMTVQLT